MKTGMDCTCPSCGRIFHATAYNSVNVEESPELKQMVMSGEIFLSECPFCGKKTLLKYPFLYYDPSKKLIVCLSEKAINVEGAEDFTARRVENTGELIEKVKILDAGLDDRVMELCKFVTRQEIGKSVELKFLKMDGPDNEITLTYPENGQMEMLAIGFNVYEDCRGIIARNPSMKVSGMEKVDSSWVEGFIAG